MSRSTRTLLVSGTLAAPLFVLLWAAQASTRAGFRPAFHPMSLLALGDFGWVQTAAFIATGALVVGGGLGLRRALGAGRLTNWATALITIMGAGLVMAGVFVTDAGAGFPPGAPEGAPEMSWHGVLHEVGFILSQAAFIAAGAVLAVRFGRARQRGWMVVCCAAVLVAALVSALGDPETLAIRLVVSAAVELGLIAAIAGGCLLRRVR